ncbi:MAG TPA: TRAP transporter small permease [Burkholderiaceae bacterium]|nr:TRAP transporter small permease [Burkholderiaceae bacterium]
MSHGFELEEPSDKAHAAPAAVGGPPKGIAAAVARLNDAIVQVGGLALVAACVVLTWGVAMRYVFRSTVDWQDETTIFLLVGAVFLSAAAVQARRGHVSIEAVAVLLPARLERWRLLLVDALSLLLCAFLAWKSLTQLHESWTGNEHSISTWAPPMWIPYGLMGAGLLLLCLQLVLQIAGAVRGGRGEAR